MSALPFLVINLNDDCGVPRRCHDDGGETYEHHHRPHCVQANNSIFVLGFQEILQHGQFPRRKYVPRGRNEVLSVMHLGQRKLLMSEMGALLRLDANTEYVAVYAGAAPGVHIPLLAELFPNVTFHLYDPAPFQITETARIKVFNEYFTDDIARRYSKWDNGTPMTTRLVFICDIRRTKDERMVWEDMSAQRRWHEIMSPCLTTLKFRLPWPGNGVIGGHHSTNNNKHEVEYLDGDICLPVWGPQSTTECRLVIEEGKHARNGTRTYDCLVYEEEMAYFNRVIRPGIHDEGVMKSEWGLDGCYDCTAEVKLLERYNRKMMLQDSGGISSALVSQELKRGLLMR